MKKIIIIVDKNGDILAQEGYQFGPYDDNKEFKVVVMNRDRKVLKEIIMTGKEIKHKYY